MARCEDFPCCGHEPGCCPDFDESGRQLNMKCVCGAKLPLTSRSSICDGCMGSADEDDYYDEDADEPIPRRDDCSRCGGDGFLFQDEERCSHCAGTGKEPTHQGA